jgi:hypothetical protein
MEIISRSEAKNKGLSQYFTGTPCKNNHLAYRYVQSGSCSACIKSHSAGIEKIETYYDNSQYKKAQQRLVPYYIRVFDKDLAYYSSIVLVTCQAREPSIQMRDVWRGTQGANNQTGSSRYPFKCFAEDMETLRQVAVEIFLSSIKPVAVSHVMRQVQEKFDHEL